MYRIALIQNESEMMRYSWADIRPMLRRLNYPFDGFTAENIKELFLGLTADRYDAIVVASNACNDKVVRESLEHNKAVIDAFLQRGKGLLVSFQMRMADFKFYDFLPDPFRVSAVNRIYAGEKPRDGEVVAGQGQEGHTILRYPIKVDLTKVKRRCLTNNLVEGIYWIYLVPEHPQSYDILVEDRTYTPHRALLITSRADFPFRIVISALALDWQMHDDLWENVVRYVVEGRPSIAVISKSGSSVFDFRFLISSLEINKLPYAQYIQETIAPDRIQLDVHDTFILDPSWSERDVGRFVQASSSLIEAGQARVFYFGETSEGQPVLRAVSNVREYQIIARNAITWLVSQFPETEGLGYWAGSFWCTVDVLATLVAFDVPVMQFKDRILKTIEKHDRDGSYDEVLGATCAMFEIYNLFLGRDHFKTRRALKWILDRVYGKTLFEQATGYEVLTCLGVEVSQRNLLAFKNEVMSNLPSLDNEFTLYRYGKALLTCGFIDEAEQVAMRLEGLQDSRSGKWVNVPNTAAIVELLIDIQKATRKPKPKIDEMIFKGVQFLRTTYTPTEYSWKSDVSATAKSLKALRAFEQRISFPIDVITAAVEVGDVRARNYIAIEAASALNVRLQNQVNDLTKRVEELRDSIKILNETSSFAVHLSAILTVVVSAIATFALLFTRYLAQQNLLANGWAHLKAFISQSALLVLPTVALVPLISLIYILRKLNKWPAWLSSILSPFIKVEAEEER